MFLAEYDVKHLKVSHLLIGGYYVYDGVKVAMQLEDLSILKEIMEIYHLD